MFFYEKILIKPKKIHNKNLDTALCIDLKNYLYFSYWWGSVVFLLLLLNICLCFIAITIYLFSFTLLICALNAAFYSLKKNWTLKVKAIPVFPSLSISSRKSMSRKSNLRSMSIFLDFSTFTPFLGTKA